jgi:hypothetical protein
MYPSTYLNWFRRLLILGAVVAGLTASAAGARLDPGTGSDVSDVASTLSATPSTDVSRPPDVRDAATSVAQGPAYSLGPGYLQYIQKTGWFSPALVRARNSVPDVFERYAAAHPHGFDLTSSELVSSPPDVQDAMAALHTTPSPVDRIIAQERGRHGDFRVFGSSLSTPAQSTLVSRPPDVSDAAQMASSVSTVRGNGFDWNDWAIGIGTGLGLALLLGVGFMVGRQQRHRVQPA